MLKVAMGQYIGWIESHNFSVDTVTTRRIYLEYFHEWCRERGLETPTQITRLQCLKSFFQWMARQNLLLHNPASEIVLPRMGSRLPKYVLNTEEAVRVIQQPDIGTPEGLRDRAILETFYSTGMRRMELAHLKVYDIDNDRGTVTIRHTNSSTAYTLFDAFGRVKNSAQMTSGGTGSPYRLEIRTCGNKDRYQIQTKFRDERRPKSSIQPAARAAVHHERFLFFRHRSGGPGRFVPQTPRRISEDFRSRRPWAGASRWSSWCLPTPLRTWSRPARNATTGPIWTRRATYARSFPHATAQNHRRRFRFYSAPAHVADEKPGDGRRWQAVSGPGVRRSSASEMKSNRFGAEPGSLGPVGILNMRVRADLALEGRRNMIAGANRNDYHLRNVTPGRDFQPEYSDVRQVAEGDLCAEFTPIMGLTA